MSGHDSLWMFLRRTLGAELRRCQRKQALADTLGAVALLAAVFAVLAWLAPAWTDKTIRWIDQARISARELLLAEGVASGPSANTLAGALVVGLGSAGLLALIWCLALAVRGLRAPCSTLGSAYRSYQRSPANSEALAELAQYLRAVFSRLWTPRLTSVPSVWDVDEARDLLIRSHPRTAEEPGNGPVLAPQMKVLAAGERHVRMFTRQQISPGGGSGFAATLLALLWVLVLIAGGLWGSIQPDTAGQITSSDPPPAGKEVAGVSPETVAVYRHLQTDWRASGGVVDAARLAALEKAFAGTDLPEAVRRLKQIPDRGSQQLGKILEDLPRSATDPEKARVVQEALEEAQQIKERLAKGTLSPADAEQELARRQEMIEEGKRLQKLADQQDQEAEQHEAKAREAREVEQKAKEDIRRAEEKFQTAANETERQEALRRKEEAERKAREAAQNQQRHETAANTKREEARTNHRRAENLLVKGAVVAAALTIHPVLGLVALWKVLSGGGFGPGGPRDSDGGGGPGQGGGTGSNQGSGTGPGSDQEGSTTGNPSGTNGTNGSDNASGQPGGQPGKGGDPGQTSTPPPGSRNTSSGKQPDKPGTQPGGPGGEPGTSSNKPGSEPGKDPGKGTPGGTPGKATNPGRSNRVPDKPGSGPSETPTRGPNSSPPGKADPQQPGKPGTEAGNRPGSDKGPGDVPSGKLGREPGGPPKKSPEQTGKAPGSSPSGPDGRSTLGKPATGAGDRLPGHPPGGSGMQSDRERRNTGPRLGGLGHGEDVRVQSSADGKGVAVTNGSSGATVAVLPDQKEAAESRLTRVFPNAGVLFTGRDGTLKLADAAGSVRDTGLKLADLGVPPGQANPKLSRAQELILRLTARKSPPRLVWKARVDGKDSWAFHVPGDNLLVWVVDEGDASRLRERVVGAELLPTEGLPSEVPGFFEQLARVSPRLSADSLELIRHLPVVRRPSGGLRAVVVLFEGKDPERRAHVHVYDPARKEMVLRGVLSLDSYRSLLDRGNNLHPTGEKLLFTRWLDDLAGKGRADPAWQAEGWLLAAVNCDRDGDLSVVLTRKTPEGVQVRYLPLHKGKVACWYQAPLPRIQERYVRLRTQPSYRSMPAELRHTPLEQIFDVWTGHAVPARAEKFPVWIRNRDEVLALFP